MAADGIVMTFTPFVNSGKLLLNTQIKKSLVVSAMLSNGGG
jgi:hypothetical protein